MDGQRNEIFFYKHLQLSSLYAYSSIIYHLSILWHVRLGHPSDFVVNKFLGFSKKSSIFIAMFVCVLSRPVIVFL